MCCFPQVWVSASGVIAVVTFGLIGSATLQWGMSKKLVQTGACLAFYDVFVFILNGIIFFYVGSSCTNLIIRSDFYLAHPDGHTEVGGVTSTSYFFFQIFYRMVRPYHISRHVVWPS